MASTRLKHASPSPEVPPASAHTPAAIPGGAAELVLAHDEIARLAYTYWEARGRQCGSPEEDWVRAERELRARLSVAVA